MMTVLKVTFIFISLSLFQFFSLITIVSTRVSLLLFLFPFQLIILSLSTLFFLFWCGSCYFSLHHVPFMNFHPVISNLTVTYHFHQWEWKVTLFPNQSRYIYGICFRTFSPSGIKVSACFPPIELDLEVSQKPFIVNQLNYLLSYLLFDKFLEFSKFIYILPLWPIDFLELLHHGDFELIDYSGYSLRYFIMSC